MISTPTSAARFIFLSPYVFEPTLAIRLVLHCNGFLWLDFLLHTPDPVLSTLAKRITYAGSSLAMPKQPIARKTTRAAPYPLSTTSNMASQVAYYPISAHTPTMAPHPSNDWTSGYSYTSQTTLMQLPDMMNQMPPTPHNPTQAQNGPWTTEEDEILCDCRTRGFGWAQIQEKHFPGKSANACRKRHERLMTKRRSTDWDESRLQNLAVNYRQMREQIWGPLADRLGEKWEHVEKAVREESLLIWPCPTLTAFSACNKA